MKIGIVGLGYVGVTTAACLTKDGHQIYGVDVNADKVAKINKGESPIIEKDVDVFIKEAFLNKKIKAFTDINKTLKDCSKILICVGTPSSLSGSIDLKYIKRVFKDIKNAYDPTFGPKDLIIRSTVLPTTTKELILPLIAEEIESENFNLFFHPEFLREGSAVKDYYNPPKIVVGELKPGTASRVLELYKKIDAPKISTKIDVAEMVKYSDNIFHALKISFANEVGYYCNSKNIDSIEVMDIFKKDKKLNISKNYLNPGFAFGGSCLPKDLNAFSFDFKNNQKINLPLIESINKSNENQINRAYSLIKNFKPHKIGVYGLTFKEGTDDIRESPYLKIVQKIKEDKINFSIYDPLLSNSEIFGQNKEYYLKNDLSEDLFVSGIDNLLDCDIILINHLITSQDLNFFLSKNMYLIDFTSTIKLKSDRLIKLN